MSFISLFGSLNEEPEKPEEPEEQKAGFFSRMKQAVSRTRESFSSKIEGIVALTRTVDEAALEDLESRALDQRPGRADDHRNPGRAAGAGEAAGD